MTGGYASQVDMSENNWEPSKTIEVEGGEINGLTINPGYDALGNTINLTIKDNGIVKNATIYHFSNGSFEISAGGKLQNAVLNHAGYGSPKFEWIKVSSGGTIESAKVMDGARVMVFESGLAMDMSVAETSTFLCISGGSASKTVLVNGGTALLCGGQATDTTLNDGSFLVSSGGTAQKTVIEAADENFDEVVQAAYKAAKKVEDEFVLTIN